MVLWLIGLSGAGKTTLAQEIVTLSKENRHNVVLIDGDMIREVFSNDLGYTIKDRKKNADRICRLCKFLNDQNIHVVCAILSIFHESQQWNRQNIKNYYEVYIDTPLEHLIKRDPKGIYHKALNNQLKDVAGIDLEFIPPHNPNQVIKNNGNKKNLLSYAPQLVKILGSK